MSPNPTAPAYSVTRRQLLSLVVFAAAVAAVFALTPIKTDMSVFFARGDTLAQRLLADELLAGASSRVVLIGLEGPDTDTVVAASRALHAALSDHPDIASIRNGAQELTDAERDFLMRYRYLFSAQWNAQSFGSDGLRAALEEQLRKLRSAFAPWAKQTLTIDPLDQFWTVLRQEAPHTAPALADGVWIDATGRLAPLVAQLRAGTDDLDAQERALRAIERAFESTSGRDQERAHGTSNGKPPTEESPLPPGEESGAGIVQREQHRNIPSPQPSPEGRGSEDGRDGNVVDAPAGKVTPTSVQLTKPPTEDSPLPPGEGQGEGIVQREQHRNTPSPQPSPGGRGSEENVVNAPAGKVTPTSVQLIKPPTEDSPLPPGEGQGEGIVQREHHRNIPSPQPSPGGRGSEENVVDAPAGKVTPPNAVQLILTGAPVFATQSRATIRDEVAWLSTLSTVFVTGILWLALRRKEYVLLGSLPLLAGIVAGTAAVGALFGSVHGITLAFGATILGVAIDYPIHLFAHLTPGESAAATFRRLWPTLLLVCVTTAVGYGAMALSSFSGLAQLGVFAIAGLAAAVATTGLWLPHLLCARPPPPIPRWAETAPAALHGARTARIAILVAFAALIAAAPLIDPGDATPWWNDDIQSLNTVSAEQRATDARLRGALGAPSVRHLIVVTGADEQDALTKSETLLPLLETLQRDGAIAGFDAAARHVPSIATQHARQRQLPAPEYVGRNLAKAVTALPFRPGTFEPFIADLKTVSTLAPARIADAPTGVMKLRLDTLLRPVGDQWLALIQLHDPLDAARVAATLDELRRDDVVALDLQAATGSMLRDYRREAVRWAAVGGIVLWLVLALRLRPLSRALFAALPAALAVAGTVAALHLAGVPLTLFHVVALLLVAGLALDYALFFFRSDALPNDHGATLFAIIVCAITTAAVFCALAASSVPILTMLGVTVTLGIALTFIATLALAGFARSTS